MGLYKRNGVWYARWFEGDKLRRCSLQTKSKTQAKNRFAEIVQAQRRAKKLGFDLEGATAESRPLDLVDEYTDDMERRKLSEQHRLQKHEQLTKLFNDIGAATLKGLTTDRIRGGLSLLSHLGARAQNDYRSAVHAFFEWLVNAGRWPRNPVKGIAVVKELDEPRRRALTPGQLQELLRAAPRHRSIVYRVCATLGLRRSEVNALTAEQLDLELGWAKLRAAGTKAKKYTEIPIIAPTAEAILEWRSNPVIVEKGRTRPAKNCPERSKKDKQEHWTRKKLCRSFLPRAPSVETFHGDLASAKIPIVENGRELVFHSLRATHITNLWRAGMSAAEVCRYGRVADIKTAMKHYTHLELQDDELMRLRYEALLSPGKRTPDLSASS